MTTRPPLGPARKACTRCRHQKRKCDNEQPSCSLCARLGQTCIYEDPGIAPWALLDDALDDAFDDRSSNLTKELTLSEIKANIIARIHNTDPTDLIRIYSRTIHTWFGILSQSTVSGNQPTTWDTVPVDFALLCFAIVLLDVTPHEVQGSYSLYPKHMSMYLMGKTWVSLLEGLGLNTVNFVKARLMINLFEVSHGFNLAAYVSIANTIRAADALVLFREEGKTLLETDRDECTILWHGITILDRYIATINDKWPPVTSCQSLSPESSIENQLHLLEHPANSLSRLFEASTLLDNVHTAIQKPTSQISFNIEEVTIIMRTLKSFETVIKQEIPQNSRIFSSPLALSSTALLLVFENGSKPMGTADTITSQALAAMDELIDDILEMTAELHGGSRAAEHPTIPPFTSFLVYKAARVTLRKLQVDIEANVILQKLRGLRHTLELIAQRWLCAKNYLNLLDEDISPRILKAIYQ